MVQVFQTGNGFTHSLFSQNEKSLLAVVLPTMCSSLMPLATLINWHHFRTSAFWDVFVLVSSSFETFYHVCFICFLHEKAVLLSLSCEVGYFLSP